MPGGVGGAVSDGRPYPDMFLLGNINTLAGRVAFVSVAIYC